MNALNGFLLGFGIAGLLINLITYTAVGFLSTGGLIHVGISILFLGILVGQLLYWLSGYES